MASEPVCKTSVPCSVPTIAGTPNSRLTIAAWHVRPPRFGHDGLGLFHDRLPVRVGLIGDKDLALAKFMERFHVLNHAHRACGDLFANTAPRDQHVPAGFEMVNLDDVSILARLHRFGPRLEDKEFARPAVLGPLDIHRRPAPALLAVMVFDDAGPSCKQQDLVVGNGKATALGRRHRDVLDTLPTADVIHQLEFLCAECFLQDRPLSVTQRRLKDVVFVGID